MTSLGALLREAGVSAELPEDSRDLSVTTVELDSRKCTKGSVFVCMPGTSTTGEAFVGDALARGAICVVASTQIESAPVVVRVDRAALRGVLASLSSVVVGNPASELTLAGVTGTNGKTTVTWLLRGILSQTGFYSSAIGTLTGERTTPSAPELHRELRVIADGAAAAGLHGAVAMEVSSHALDQGRTDGLRFDVSVFTNLSHEHLDYHGTMDRYFEAKSALFDEARSAAAVVCVDDEWGRRLRSRHPASVAVSSAEATNLRPSIGSTSFVWRSRAIATQLTGRVNATNAMLALAAAQELGLDDVDTTRAIANVAPVPGRLEVVAAGSPSVLVDYAHTPAALERVLVDLRSIVGERPLVVVFGCGGERDRLKRPLMGSIATRLADRVVLTSDNPRGEDPVAIIDEIAAGADGPASLVIEPDRATAIAGTIAAAHDDDVILVAGKGHETTQEVAGTLLEFDDRVAARDALTLRRRAC